MKFWTRSKHYNFTRNVTRGMSTKVSVRVSNLWHLVMTNRGMVENSFFRTFSPDFWRPWPRGKRDKEIGKLDSGIGPTKHITFTWILGERECKGWKGTGRECVKINSRFLKCKYDIQTFQSLWYLSQSAQQTSTLESLWPIKIIQILFHQKFEEKLWHLLFSPFPRKIAN